MLARLLCVIAITGCFEARTPADRPHTVVYKALEIGVGLAIGFVGYELAADKYAAAQSEHGDANDGLAAVAGVMTVGGGVVMSMCGLGGIFQNYLDVPAR